MGCEDNQRRAARAVRLLESGASIFVIDRIDVDRLMVCGPCPRAKELLKDHKGSKWLDPGLAYRVCRELLQSVEDVEWYRGDPEVSALRKKNRQKRWRDANKTKTKEYMAKRRTDARSR